MHHFVFHSPNWLPALAPGGGGLPAELHHDPAKASQGVKSCGFHWMVMDDVFYGVYPLVN